MQRSAARGSYKQRWIKRFRDENNSVRRFHRNSYIRDPWWKVKALFNRQGKWITWLSVLLLCTALIITTVRWRQSEKALDATVLAMKAQSDAIERNRLALSELCRTNGIMNGVLSELKDLRITEIKSGKFSKDLTRRYRVDKDILQGYLNQLDQQTACVEIINP